MNANKNQIYLPVVYALNTFGLCFATISSLFVWLYLEKRGEIMAIVRDASLLGGLFKKKKIISRRRLQPAYQSVPTRWFVYTAVLSLGLAIFVCEYYPVQLRWHGAIFSFLVSAMFFVPVSLTLPSSFHRRRDR